MTRTPRPWPGMGAQPLPPDAALHRLAQAVLALKSTTDLPALVDVFGETMRAGLSGRAWRFLHVDPESGTLREHGPSGRVYLPEPGGAVEWLLQHEAPLFVRPGQGPCTLEDALWDGPPRALAGLPVTGGTTLHGLLLVSLERPLPSGDPAAVHARLLADQFGFALERAALGSALERERARMGQLEARASSGEQLFSDLISVVAHEIRTPLTSIKAYTETLIDAPEEEFGRRREFLGVIDEECDRLARLVSDALDLSRLEAGQRLLKVRPLDARALLEDVSRTLEPDAARTNVRFECVVAPEVRDVEGDSDLLKQLLLNLAGNAVKFAPPDSIVTIEATAEAGSWSIAVRDRGCGIPEAELERIFERFHRVELRGGRRVPGTGLGLAIARNIVDLHGGSVRAANAPDGGSVFTVTLPARQLAPAEVRRVSGEIAGREDVRDLLAAAVEMISELMQAQIVSVMLVDPAEGDLFVAASRGLDEGAAARRLHYRGGVAGAVVQAGQPVLVENIETDRRFGKKSHAQYFTKSLLCAPVTVAGRHVGVVNVNNKASREEFDDRDLALLTNLVARLSAALSRAHAYPDAPGVVGEARAAMMSLARVRRDLWLGGRELARYARRVAERVGLPAATAGLVGQLAACRTGSCAAATAAAGPVDGTEGPWSGPPALRAEARAILLARAERLDGSGYPLGLAGSAIPPAARVLAVVDEFEALTRGRAYRTALTVDEALAELDRHAGVRFEARVVDAFAAVLAEEGWLGHGGEGDAGDGDAGDAGRREAA